MTSQTKGPSGSYEIIFHKKSDKYSLYEELDRMCNTNLYKDKLEEIVYKSVHFIIKKAKRF